MKREILFRGKRIDNSEWIEGDLSHDVITGKVYISRQDGYPPTWNDPGGCDIYVCVEVNPETVGQYTGIKDKNRKMIFEGDILVNNKGENGEVVFFEGKFCLKANRKNTIWYMPLDNGFLKNKEITGNIHDK